MSKVELVNDNDEAYCLLNHCVIKQTSEKTRLRIVFDSTAKAAYRLSLNGIQYVNIVV